MTSASPCLACHHLVVISPGPSHAHTGDRGEAAPSVCACWKVDQNCERRTNHTPTPARHNPIADIRTSSYRTVVLVVYRNSKTMNEESISVLSNLAPAPHSSPCGSLSRIDAADSLLSLLRTSPRRMPPYCTNTSNSKRACCSPPLIVVPSSPITEDEQQQQQPPPTKRLKRCSTNNNKQVTFAPNDDDLVTFIACPPYVHGLTDAECLQLYRSDIWFTVRRVMLCSLWFATYSI